MVLTHQIGVRLPVRPFSNQMSGFPSGQRDALRTHCYMLRGSNPSPGTSFMLESWCNGSILCSGHSDLGSIPGVSFFVAVAKLVDSLVLKTSPERVAGSSPVSNVDSGSYCSCGVMVTQQPCKLLFPVRFWAGALKLSWRNW